MALNNSLQHIANRLFAENICSIPLDEKSLETIDKYMNYYIPYSDLCRRLSDIEFNYVQISAEADDACQSISQAKSSVIYICRGLIDKLESEGYLKGFFRASEDSDNFEIATMYTSALEFIRDKLKILSSNLLTLSETAAQIRACSASFTEVYKESKLAIYAAMLQHDVEAILDCRATSLQAHASAKECERLSAKLLGKARICTQVINCINNTIIEINQSLNIDTYEYALQSKISPMKVNNVISASITILNNLNIEK